MDRSAAVTAIKVAEVSPRPLFLARRVNRRALRTGKMDDQPGIGAHSQMMDLDSAFCQRGESHSTFPRLSVWHACLMGGLEWRESTYRSGRSDRWIKVKNRAHAAFSRVLE